jgi:hypothetical protein
MLRLALEWDKTEKVPPKIQMLPGENERDRVLADDEENCYLTAATKVGADIHSRISSRTQRFFDANRTFPVQANSS